MSDKAALRDAVLALLEAELNVLTAAAHESHDEATNQENRPEGKYDMRAQSAAYLAAGQAKLATALGEAIAAYRSLPTAPLPGGAPATTGALLSLDHNGSTQWYYLGPARGGMEISWDDKSVTVITPSSPLGRQLVGKRAGEISARGKLMTVI
jgi:transcription elongation GreA/GreB family factor